MVTKMFSDGVRVKMFLIPINTFLILINMFLMLPGS